MRNNILYILTIFTLLNGQSAAQIKKQIKNAGLTIDQAKQIANDQGYSDDQLQLEAQSRGIELDQSKNNYRNDINNQNIDNANDEVVENPSQNNVTNKIDNSELSFFGYNIFQGDPGIFQSSSFGSIDPNYNIGPGDQIIVMLWGESQFRQEFIIDREGYVFIPEIGQVFVNGLNLQLLEKKFFQILSKVYSTLNPDNSDPTTFMDVSIGNIRPLRIIVLGELSQPGAYSISPSTSLSSSLYYFKGPTINGSLRDIKLIRKGEVIKSIDFYNYLLSGNVPNDIRLQMDDVVFLSKRGKTVTIKGEINRQAHYELLNRENLLDLINIAGGIMSTAYTNRVQISRIVPSKKRKLIGMDRMIMDVDLNKVLSNEDLIELYDGDIVEIFPIEQESRNYVKITGNSVARPGVYQLTPGMKLLDLINASEGLLSDAYTNTIHIKRINQDLTSQLLTINSLETIENDSKNNIDLKYMDEVYIYNYNQLNNVFNEIKIIGEVKNPGLYKFHQNITVGDIVIASGGLSENIFNVKISITRSLSDNFKPKIFYFPKSKNEYIDFSNINNPNSDINNFVLYPNDIISIYPSPKNNIADLVNISGAVYHPGSYPIIKSNEKVSDILNRAGGLLSDAYPFASVFIRNNEKVKISFDEIIKNPKSKDNFMVLPGDKIIINKRTNTVKVLGEVNAPGVYMFYKGKSLNDYISIAGGYSVDAELKEVWINYPNGNSLTNRRFLSPSVLDGSVITVGVKKNEEPFNVTEYAKELTSIISNIVQVIILYSAINR
ncbi:MAG: hypothetical protein CMG57_09650 [Candidatus Marinimicrobia bacterium]|nr:hypothetical protein [Candidatus Neomarinimicrobiota bacterium]|tara:strand:- start:5784 stop:8111 length:2328 start_codon:yes stop_codon:yes gene_type:complete